MEPNNNTTEKILAAIETQKVTPRPKWYFVLRNSVLWIPGLVTTLLGAYAIAGLLYGILHAHWEDRLSPYSSPLVFIVAIPLLWILSFALFSVVTISLVRKTSGGYRHTAMQLLLVSVGISVIIGALFYGITQNTLDNEVRTYYRYPTEHQDQYYRRMFPPQAERNFPTVRIY